MLDRKIETRMRTVLTLLVLTAFANAADSAEPDCASFYYDLNNEQNVLDNHGKIEGQISFGRGINQQSVSFDAGAFINFPTCSRYNVRGSVSLWFRKQSSQSSGGIWQIGSADTGNSLFLFYDEMNHLRFRLRNTKNETATAIGFEAIEENKFTHITASWEERGDQVVYIRLFVNGIWVGSDSVQGSLEYDYQHRLQIGRDNVHENCGGNIDELRHFQWPPSDAEVYAEYVYSSNEFRYEPSSRPVSTGPVRIAGNLLFVNDMLFQVKGVVYRPSPIGRSLSSDTIRQMLTDPRIIQRDLPILKEMHVNTVRLLDEPPESSILDECWEAGLYVIMPFNVETESHGLPVDYASSDVRDSYRQEFSAYVNAFKHHPAVLGWAIGNENNLLYGGDIADWYSLANELGKTAHEVEGEEYHPTILINASTLYFGNTSCNSDDLSLDHIDVWGHNTYASADYHAYFCYYNKISAKPLIVTEFGADAWDNRVSHENESIQATSVLGQWNQIKANCLGGVVREYLDQWDGCYPEGSPSNHDTMTSGGCGYYYENSLDGYSDPEWYGLLHSEPNVPVDDVHAREAYHKLKEAYEQRSWFPLNLPWSSRDYVFANTDNVIVAASTEPGEPRLYVADINDSAPVFHGLSFDGGYLRSLWSWPSQFTSLASQKIGENREILVGSSGGVFIVDPNREKSNVLSPFWRWRWDPSGSLRKAGDGLVWYVFSFGSQSGYHSWDPESGHKFPADRPIWFDIRTYVWAGESLPPLLLEDSGYSTNGGEAWTSYIDEQGNSITIERAEAFGSNILVVSGGQLLIGSVGGSFSHIFCPLDDPSILFFVEKTGMVIAGRKNVLFFTHLTDYFDHVE